MYKIKYTPFRIHSKPAAGNRAYDAALPDAADTGASAFVGIY